MFKLTKEMIIIFFYFSKPENVKEQTVPAELNSLVDNIEYVYTLKKNPFDFVFILYLNINTCFIIYYSISLNSY